MKRRNRTPEENAHRAKIRELLQSSNISSMDDIQNLFKETIVEFRSERRENQTSISRDIEEKILSMYAKGMTTSDIAAHIHDIRPLDLPVFSCYNSSVIYGRTCDSAV